MFLLRSSRPEVFLRKGVQKTCSKFTGENPCRCDFNKVALLLLLISWLFSEHTFQGTPLDDCFCFYCSFFPNFNNVLNPSTTLPNDSSDRNVEIVQDSVQLFSWNFSLNVFFQCLSCFWAILVQAHHFIKKESLVQEFFCEFWKNFKNVLF